MVKLCILHIIARGNNVGLHYAVKWTLVFVSRLYSWIHTCFLNIDDSLTTTLTE